LREATGRPATTIAAFLRGVEDGTIAPTAGSLLVIDEASMLDLPTIYRIMRRTPEGCRILLVGDPGQLPPIGFGLVMHALVERPEIPRVELVRVHRQTENTGIPVVARAVRAGEVPRWLGDVREGSHGVALLDTDQVTSDDVVDVVERLGGFAGDLRILCPVKAGPVGTEALNRRFHDIVAVGRRRHPTRHMAEGEPVMFLRNDYRRDLRNGSLGEVAGINGEVVVVDFDGVRHELSGRALDDPTLAYAITVHKAQGSSFRRVVFPFTRSRLLDRSLVYTAITRAVDLAVLVGGTATLRTALENDSHAARRETCLAHLLEDVHRN
jgi:exodeoxyribonuclease V alpha subunit